MPLELIARLGAGLIVLIMILAVYPLILSIASSPICSLGEYQSQIDKCVIDKEGDSCPGNWIEYQGKCVKTPLRNTSTGLIIIGLAVVLWLASVVFFIARGKKY